MAELPRHETSPYVVTGAVRLEFGPGGAQALVEFEGPVESTTAT